MLRAGKCTTNPLRNGFLELRGAYEHRRYDRCHVTPPSSPTSECPSAPFVLSGFQSSTSLISKCTRWWGGGATQRERERATVQYGNSAVNRVCYSGRGWEWEEHSVPMQKDKIVKQIELDTVSFFFYFSWTKPRNNHIMCMSSKRQVQVLPFCPSLILYITILIKA